MRRAWNEVRLGDVATIILSGVDKHVVTSEAEVRLCNYLDVYRNRRLTKEMAFSAGSARPAEVERFTLKRGDLVITKDSETPDDIGIPALVADDLDGVICGYHLAIIRPRSGKALPEFLLHYLQSDATKRHFLRTAAGLTRFGIGARAISSLPVPVLPLHEQAAVGRTLDVVDIARDRTRTAVRRAQELRASLLAHLLSHGVGPDGKARDNKTDATDLVSTTLGRLPADWRLSVLDDEFGLQTGFTLNPDRRARFKGRPYLRVANVQRDDLDLSDVQELEAGDSEFAPRTLQLDDLLVVEGHADRMQIGRCARVTQEAVGMTFQNHLFRLRTKGAVIPAFACLWLNSVYAQRFWNARCATSSGLNTINQRMLKKVVIPVPTVAEQQIIAAIDAQQRQYISALLEKQMRLESLKRSLMHDLFTGRVRLQVPVEDVAA